MTRGRLHFLLAAAGYLLIALWCYRAVLPDPFGSLPVSVDRLKDPRALELYRSDQRFVVGVVAEGARRIAAGDFDLLEQSTCFPLADSGTLGEHMIGESLLGALPYALTGDPIFTFNAMGMLFFSISALSMYTLSYFWTGHPGAAFLAGFLFAFHPARVTNLAHPFTFGNLWTPLALLAAHQLFTRQRWRDACLLALTLSLQLLESLYPLLALTILGGTYGLFLIARSPSSLPRLLPKLLFVAVVTGGVAAAIFGPYLHTREVWNTLQGRPYSLLQLPSDYLPGGNASVGILGPLLALLGLYDRLRRSRPRDGYDPRWILTLGGILVLWATLRRARVGSLRIDDISPLVWLRDLVPGLDAVRVLSALRFGVFLVIAFLAAYGVLFLVERLRGRSRSLAVSALLLLAIIETLYGPAAHAVYQWNPNLVADQERPSPGLLELIAKAPDGALLDLPAGRQTGFIPRLSRSIFLAAYHQRPVAACYNSFTTPLQAEVAALAQALPDPKAADALYALGFRILVVHEGGKAFRPDTLPALNQMRRLLLIGRTRRQLVFELRSPLAATEDRTALTPAPAATPITVPPASVIEVPLSTRNRSNAVFRHAPPIQPGPLEVEWRDPDGNVVGREKVRALLPIALAPGARTERRLLLRTPAVAGEYYVAARVAGDDQPIAAARVRVTPAAPRPGPATSTAEPRQPLVATLDPLAG